VLEELDYELEAQNQRMFARHYRNHPFIRIPDVHTRLCSDSVLVTDWIDGKPLAAAEAMTQAERDRIAEIIFRFYVCGGYDLLAFSGDPHPGNSLILDDGTVAFIDFGLLKRIDRQTAELELLGARAISDRDGGALIDGFAQQGITFDPERFTPDDVLDGVLLTQGWFLSDDYPELTPDITNRIAAFAADPRGPIYRIFKGQTLPPAHMVQRRVEIQVLSIVGQLRPRVNFHAIMAEYAFGDGPATELGQLAAEWRDGAPLAV
jgi:hypothetical protein